MQNKYRILGAIIALFYLNLSISFAEGRWVDVTSEYFNNPSFNSPNYNEWVMTRQSRYGNIQSQNGVMEMWNSMFNMTKNINVENGKYRFSLQGLYRCGSHEQAYINHTNGTEKLVGYFAANDVAKLLNCQYDWAFDTNPGHTCYHAPDNKYYINSMSAAELAFEQYDALWNSLECKVTNGSLKLQVYNTEYKNDNWLVFDNIKLERWVENFVEVTRMSISKSTIEDEPGKEHALSVTLYPTNATIKNVEWSSSNPEVAKVDENGVVTTISRGECVITATSKSNPSVKASCKVKVTTTMGDASSLIVNEIMTGNVDCYFSLAGNYDKWIELYNPTDKDVYFAGYYLSDDSANPRKWHIPANDAFVPAKGYRVIYFDSHAIDGRQCGFDLDCDGGVLYMNDENGKNIWSMDYPPAVSRCSYARQKDAQDTWGWSSAPTPGASNNKMAFATIRLEAPEVSTESKMFDAEFQFSVNIPSGCVLIYTTDGSTPSKYNGKTNSTGLFTVYDTMNYRFCLAKTGYLTSPVVTRSFIKRDYNLKLPVISIVTDDKNLNDPTYGCKVRGNGTFGMRGNGQSSPVNWNMDWDRPVSMQYILPNGTVAVDQELNYSVSGGWTRSNTPQSFKLKASKKFDGNSFIPYSFWKAKPHIKSKTIQVRAGGNDTDGRIKDALVQGIIQNSGVNCDVVSYQPAVVYVNGQYNGIMNVREPNNKHYVYANFGLDEDEIEMYEQSPDSGAYMMIGDAATLDRIYELAENAEDENAYEELTELLDIDEYVWYMAAKLHGGDWDWPDNNLKAWRKTDGGKYRYTFFDADMAFSNNDPFSLFNTYQWHWYDAMYREDGSTYQLYGEIKFVTMFFNLLKNESFRNRFVTTMSIMAGSVFEPNKATEIIDNLVNEVKYIANMTGINSVGVANSIKNSLSNRATTLANSMKNYQRFEISNLNQAQVSSDNAGGKIFINDIEVPYGYFNGYIDYPATLKAEAPGGMEFLGWKNKAQSIDNTLVERESDWKYYDKGSLDGTNWKEASYDDSAWDEGKAPLGYSKNENTVLDYGNNPKNKRITYYFRKEVNLSSSPTIASMNYTVDDGFVMYINGKKAASYNIVDNPTYNTVANTYAHDNPDSGSTTLDVSLFKKGKNIIAVELHNNDVTSSDVVWDCDIRISESTNATEIFCTDAEISMPSGAVNLQACFGQKSAEELIASGVAPICINEVSASNSIYTNEYFKKNDWIELYNTTANDIDVEGMYLSDDVNNPKKFQIQKSANVSTIIPAHGYMVVWCDKQEALTELHTNFKLSAESGKVILTSADEKWNDVFAYNAHEGDETVIRYPDGTNSFYTTNVPTIGKANITSFYMTEMVYHEPETTIITIIGNNNGVKIKYIAEKLVIHTEERLDGTVGIYTTNGQMVSSVPCHLNSGKGYIDVAYLPAGIYVAKVVGQDGITASCKFIISK